MTLMFPLLDQPIRFAENSIQVLIIENPLALRQFMEGLCAQIDGQSGNIVLAVKYVPQELSSTAAIMLDPFHLDTDSKKLTGRIQQAAAQVAENYGEKLRILISEINVVASEISMGLDFSATFEPIENVNALIKLMGFRLDRETLSFPELLLEWMRIQRRFLGKRLFIFYGLKSWLSLRELEGLYRSVFYEKFNVLLVEPFQRFKSLEGECLTIIDEDLCVIT